MKTISEQDIQSIMQKAPQLTREQIVEGLKQKGYDVPGPVAATPTPAPGVSGQPNTGAPSGGIKVGPLNLGNMGNAITTGLKGLFLGPQSVLPDLVAKNPELASKVGGAVVGSTAQLLAKPAVSLRAGLTGDYKPVNVPVAGPVRPYETPLSPASQYIQNGLKLPPQEAAVAKEIGKQNLQEAAGTTAGAALEAESLGLSDLIGNAVKRPLTKIAEKLYQSALKPSEEALKQGVVKTGLKENVWLTNGGVERAAQKIDDLEAQLGAAIEAGKAEGKKVATAGLKEFVDPIRKWFETVDVAASDSAQEYIDKTLSDFGKRYGKNIPIEEAQKLKVNTMRYLRNAYGELSSVQKETSKQIARFLKDGIVEQAPAVGDVNARLKALYALDESLSSASRRIRNMNLLGLGQQLGTAVGGGKGFVLGTLAKLADTTMLKSGAALGANALANTVPTQAITVPLTTLLNYALGRGSQK